VWRFCNRWWRRWCRFFRRLVEVREIVVKAVVAVKQVRFHLRARVDVVNFRFRSGCNLRGCLRFSRWSRRRRGIKRNLFFDAIHLGVQRRKRIDCAGTWHRHWCLFVGRNCWWKIWCFYTKLCAEGAQRCFIHSSRGKLRQEFGVRKIFAPCWFLRCLFSGRGFFGCNRLGKRYWFRCCSSAH
jgi:hypothetical protein